MHVDTAYEMLHAVWLHEQEEENGMVATLDYIGRLEGNNMSSEKQIEAAKRYFASEYDRLRAAHDAISKKPALLKTDEKDAYRRLGLIYADPSFDPDSLQLHVVEMTPGAFSVCTIAPWYVKYLCEDGEMRLRDEIG